MIQDKKAYFSEITWLIFGLLICFLVGYLLQMPWLFLGLGMLAYIGWHLWQLKRLLNWLEHSSLDKLPESFGLWDTVYRRIYKQHRRANKRYDKLLNLLNRYKESTAAMPDAAIILGRNWVVEWFNAKTEKYLGLKKSQAIGKSLPNLLNIPSLLDFLKKNQAETLEVTSPVDPSLKLSIRLIPYGKKHLLIARNITRLVQLEEVRKDFVANVSHELRTPLTVISGYLETLSDELNDNEQYAMSMNLMRQQTDRMCSLIDDLLLLSRIEGSNKQVLSEQWVDVPALIMMLKKEALVLSDGKHPIKVELDTQCRWLNGVENELRSAFTNLVSNAIRYTPEKGEINIRWYRDQKQNACFEVSDSGEGIAKHHLARLSERFYRVDVGRSRAAGGTGLGLAIVKHVLNHHKARLTIDSKLGKGSTFRCIFPARLVREAEAMLEVES